ncbi:MAG TPA: hypothetical protein VE977_06895 [Pyrinomonadaceae bacterium]|nr:hypothetical protein [Pyrinomonadaceae bacterium]
MAILFLLGAVFLSALSPLSPSPASSACTSNTDACMPPGIQATDVVSSQAAKPGGKVVTISVAQKLKALRARCRKGKLVDARGTEIRFYQLIGCWGNPPDDYQEQLERQAKELAKLRKRYRVIEMTCNSSGEDRFRATPPPVSP